MPVINLIFKLNIKEIVHNHFLQLVNDRIDVLEDLISGLADGAQNDAKGSAGDKHETALSMMHLEQEKLAAKLRDTLKQRDDLSKAAATPKSDKVTLGSLVKSNGFYFYFSTALPKMQIGEKTVFALSKEAPLGAAMLGKSRGDKVTISGKEYVIEEIA